MTPKLRYSSDCGDDAGLYTWDLENDTLYADFALAELFGLDKAQAERGLPQRHYLDRVLVDDLPGLACAIREAILTGAAFQESYRVHKSNGDVVRVLALGRCFRDINDRPKFYAGIVFPMPEEQSGDDALLWQCLSALEIAKREGREDVTALLVEAIRKLNRNQSAAILRLVG